MLNKFFSVILILALLGGHSNAATRNVPGTYSTISLAAAATSPGDIVLVQDGVYDESVSVSISGTSGSMINYVAAGTNVITRRFALSSTSNLRVIGFQLVHTNTSINSTFTTSGTCSNIHILNNYAHNYCGNFIRAGGTPTYFVFRGNHIYEQGIGLGGTFQETPDTTFYMFSATGTDHWLVENNHIHRVGDFVSIYGSNHIIRNNWLHDYDPSYWAPSGWHSDAFQPGSDGASLNTKHHVYEANFFGDSMTADSHYGLFNDVTANTDTNMLCRANVGYNIGSVYWQVLTMDDVNTYNNTAYKIGQVSSGSTPFTWYGPSSPPTNGAIANTIIYDKGLPASAILIQEGVNITVSNNLGFAAGSNASFVSTSDPLFVNTNTYNFRLQSSSPARAVGMALATVTSSSGSGTAFNITSGRGKWFNDGKGVTQGDIIRVGGTNNTAVRITNITNDTLTVSASISWNNGDNVYFGNFGLDLGALPFYSQELTAASISNVSNDYTVTTTGDPRFVIFYQDSIPHTIDYDSPYTATIASGTVSAIAYPLYAQTNYAILATSGGGGGSTNTVPQLKPNWQSGRINVRLTQ